LGKAGAPWYLPTTFTNIDLRSTLAALVVMVLPTSKLRLLVPPLSQSSAMVGAPGEDAVLIPAINPDSTVHTEL